MAQATSCWRSYWREFLTRRTAGWKTACWWRSCCENHSSSSRPRSRCCCRMSTGALIRTSGTSSRVPSWSAPCSTWRRYRTWRLRPGRHLQSNRAKSDQIGKIQINVSPEKRKIIKLNVSMTTVDVHEWMCFVTSYPRGWNTTNIKTFTYWKQTARSKTPLETHKKTLKTRSSFGKQTTAHTGVIYLSIYSGMRVNPLIWQLQFKWRKIQAALLSTLSRKKKSALSCG